jgi:hypothetical protein
MSELKLDHQKSRVTDLITVIMVKGGSSRQIFVLLTFHFKVITD